jgi:hypothetical protein
MPARATNLVDFIAKNKQTNNLFFLPKPFINNLIEFCKVKNYPKFNMSYTLCPIISKSLSLNYTHQGLSINTKSGPKFPYNNVWF